VELIKDVNWVKSYYTPRVGHGSEHGYQKKCICKTCRDAFPSRSGKNFLPLPKPTVVDTILEDRRFRLSVAKQDTNGPRRQFSEVVDGCVYAITNPLFRGVKIGWAGDPYQRLCEYHMYAPAAYVLEGYDHAPSIKAEEHCHMYFNDKIIRGEWFDVTVGEALVVIKSICHALSTSGRVA